MAVLTWTSGHAADTAVVVYGWWGARGMGVRACRSVLGTRGTGPGPHITTVFRVLPCFLCFRPFP